MTDIFGNIQYDGNYWETKDGRIMPLCEMTPVHLQNAINMQKRKLDDLADYKEEWYYHFLGVLPTITTKDGDTVDVYELEANIKESIILLENELESRRGNNGRKRKSSEPGFENQPKRLRGRMVKSTESVLRMGEDALRSRFRKGSSKGQLGPN